MAQIQLSYSFIQEYQTCRRKAYYHRVEKIQPKKRPIYFTLGNMIHAGFEAWMLGLDVTHAINHCLDKVEKDVHTQEELTELQVAKATAVGIMDAYRVYYRTDLKRFKNLQTEKKITFGLLPDVSFVAILDMLVQDQDGEWMLYDHKTTSRLGSNYLEQATISNQVLGYFYAARKFLGTWPKGIVYNVIVKPSIRPRKSQGETLDQFCNRLYQTYTKEPEKYFHREEILTNKVAVKEWLEEAIDIAKEIKAAIDSRNKTAFHKNTGACFDYGSVCPYFPVCTSGDINPVLYERML